MAMEKADAQTPNEGQSSIPTNVMLESDAATEDRLPEDVKLSNPVEEEYQYVTGFKLITVIGCVTLVAFLIMLDQSIIATVGHC